MFWVYIMKSKQNDSLCIGSTSNLNKRLEEHNNSESKYTAKYKPWVLAYVEGYFLEEDARNRESKIKAFGKVYSQLKRRIKNSLRSA
jgi:putative endonuclease